MSSLALPHLHDDYLAALLAGDAVRARALVDRAVDDHLPLEDIYLGVLTPALEEIGRRWETGEIEVAWEHRATAITEGILGTLGARMRVPPVSGRLAVVACVEGESHALGARMVGDFLEGAGWEVILLGASVPSESLAALVEDEAPDVVALSTALPGALPAASRTIAELRTLDAKPWIVVGGLAWRGVSLAAGADARFDDPLTLVRELALRFPPIPDDVL